MSKKDELLVKANNLQNYLNVFLASIVGVIGWLFVSFEKQSFLINTITIIGAIVLFICAGVLQYLINKNAKNLGRLK